MLRNNLLHFDAGNKSYDILFLTGYVPAEEKNKPYPLLITSGNTTFFAICQPPILAIFFFIKKV